MKKIQDKYYEVLNDGILGAKPSTSENVPPADFYVLKGRVTSSELKAFGCDIQWLLKSGSIVELGYTPIMEPVNEAPDNNA